MRRSLGLFEVACLGLNAIVGSGIFLLPDDLYAHLGVFSPVAFVLCAVGLLPVALCYAEAAAHTERTGGPYVYASEAFGPTLGFCVGWMCFANALFSFAAVACAAAAYLGPLVPALGSSGAQKVVAVSVIALFSALNALGAKPGARAVAAFTIAKIAVLLTLVAALAPGAFASAGRAVAGAAERGGGGGLWRWDGLSGLRGLGAATFLAVFAAQGFEVAPVPAGETRDPRRTVPVAIVGSLLAACALYVVVQTVLVLSAPGALARATDTPLADAVRAVAPGLAALVTAGGVVSTLGFVAGSALGTPRYLFAVAVDGHLPARLGSVHPQRATPGAAILLTAIAAAVLALPFDYRSLIGMSNVAVATQYLATCLAVPVLRRHGPRAGWRLPGGWLVPLGGAAMSAWIVTEASPGELVWAGLSMAVGGALLLGWRLLRRLPAGG